MNRNELREITRTMLDISRCLDGIREGQFVKFGLTRGQHSFLTRICENPGINQEELSFLLKVDKSTTAKAIKKLVEQEFVMKKRPPLNRREWILFATPLGSETNQQMESLVFEPVKILYTGISDEDLKQFHNILCQIDENIVPVWVDFKNGNL